MSTILDALKKKYEAEIEEGKVNIKIMLRIINSVNDVLLCLSENITIILMAIFCSNTMYS